MTLFVLLCVLGVNLLGVVAFIGERDPAPELLTSISQRNWANAHTVMDKLKGDKLRPEVEKTLVNYLKVSEESDKGLFSSAVVFSECRSIAGELLAAGSKTWDS